MSKEMVKATLVCTSCDYKREVDVQKGKFFGMKGSELKKFEGLHCPKCKAPLTLQYPEKTKWFTKF